MAVTSRDIDSDGNPINPKGEGSKAQAAPPPRVGSWELGVVLLLFGLPQWIAGARYTFDGARIGINFLLAWMTIPARIPALDWRAMIALILLLGWVCSRVETRHFPIRSVRGKLVFIGGAALIGWALTSATDLGTTLIGVANPAADAWPITIWVASTPPALALWSIWLTFAPEWMILAGWWMLAGRRRTT
jgi:hypothetical protein